jgi:phospholipid transport system substrate-binding protein
MVASGMGRLLFLLALAVQPAFAAPAEPPREVVEHLTDQAIAVLGDKALSEDAKRERLQTLVYGAVDFDTLARLVLARHWRDFSPEQQQGFIAEFKKHLALTYGRDIENYHNERVAIRGERTEPGGDVTVQTVILRGGGDRDNFTVDYRLRQAGGTWKVIDFVIEGVSLVANYRSQFQGILSERKPAELVALLRRKNEKGETFKAPGA